MQKQMLRTCLLAFSVYTLITAAAAQSPIPSWHGSFTYDKTYTYTMIGENPNLQNANGTTIIPVKIIPVTFTYTANGQTIIFDPNTPFCGAGTSGLTTVTNSPLFQSYPFYASPSPFGGGLTFVGNTQYVDAFQRANFWGLIAQYERSSSEYHVKFGLPQLLAPRNFNIAPGDGSSPVVVDRQTPCGTEKMLTISNMPLLINDIIVNQLGIGNDNTTLYIFLTRNTQFVTNIGTVGGSHSQGSPNGITFVNASIADPGVFAAPQQDVYFLAHELAEWTDDPYSPPFNGAPACVGGVLEVADPVNGTGMSVFANGFTYNLPDLVFLTWFARGAPNPASGGYTFFGANPQTTCP